MPDSQLLAYITVVALLTVSPGADTMLVVRNVLARGPFAGVLTSLGIGSGVFVHATLSALGLSILLVRSAAAYEVVKFLGAGYLCFLGLRAIYQALHTGQKPAAATTEVFDSAIPRGPESPDFKASTKEAIHSRGSQWQSISEGFLTNLLNPKVAVFYLAFLPQFIRPSDPVLARSLLLAAIHCVLGLIWLSFVSFFIGRLSALLTRPAIRKKLELVTGSVLILFGVRLAVSSR